MVDLKETKIDGRFIIGQKLGSGSFGDIFLGTFVFLNFLTKIYKATNVDTNEVVAIKLVNTCPITFS